MTKRIYKNSSTHLPDDCRPAADVLARLGDKWTVAIIGTLSGGRRRFSELQAASPRISQRMLTMTLRALERDGLVTRIVYATVPLRVEYELSPRGRSLLEPLSAVHSWALAHTAAIESSRNQFDAAGDA